MNEIFRTDEAIIEKFAYWTVCYGNTSTFCKKLDTMKIQFQDQEKQDIWKDIFAGVKYQIANEYGLSVVEFDKARDKIAKDTLLDLFFNRQRLFSYVFSEKLDIKAVNTEYENLRDQFKDNNDPLIQSQIVGTILNESYVVWKLKGKAGLLDMCNKIIEMHKNSTDPNIQLSVAIAMNNKASVLASQGFEAGAVLVLDGIREKYGNHDDPGIIKQVIKAISRKAMLFYNNDDLENASGLYKYITDTYGNKKDAVVFEDTLVNALIMRADILGEMKKKDKALDLYGTVYKSYRNSENLNVQESVLSAALRKMEMLKATGKFNNQIKTADNAIKQFLPNDDVSIQLKLLKVMFEKAKILYYQGKWNKEVYVYNSIIKRYKSTDSPLQIKKRVLRAMRFKLISLKSMGLIDQAIKANAEAFNFMVESREFDAYLLIVLMAEKAELLMDSGDYDGYVKIYKEIYEEYINSDDAEIRVIIAALMHNRAMNEGKRGNLPEKTQLYRDIIRLFGDDTIIDDVVEIVTRTIYELGCILARDEKWDEAIEVLYSIIKYKNNGNADIRLRVAEALYDRLLYLTIKGDKKEELKAYKEFIEMFKASNKKKIKRMIHKAESEFQEKRQNPEKGVKS